LAGFSIGTTTRHHLHRALTPRSRLVPLSRPDLLERVVYRIYRKGGPEQLRDSDRFHYSHGGSRL